MKANTTAYIDLLADVAAPAAGSTLTATVAGDRVGLGDGGNSEALPAYYARTDFSPVTVEIK